MSSQSDRPVVVDRGGSGASTAIVAIIAIAVIVALLLWHPWSTTRSSTTIVNPPAVTQPQTQPNSGNAGMQSGSQAGGSSQSGGTGQSGSSNSSQ